MANIISDDGNNPVINSNFLLRVDAIFDLPCKRIGSIKYDYEYESIQAGGENDYVYLRRKHASSPYTVEIERYVGENFYDPLPVGRQPVLPIVLYVSRYANDFKHVRRTYTFTGCTVIGKTYGELDAEKSGLVVETTRLAFQKVSVLDSTDGDQEAGWGFDSSGKKYEGIGKRKAVLNTGELRKKDMETLSRKWPVSRSARTIKDIK